MWCLLSGCTPSRRASTKTGVRHGSPAGDSINYVDGASIGGFAKVADATPAQGVV